MQSFERSEDLGQQIRQPPLGGRVCEFDAMRTGIYAGLGVNRAGGITGKSAVFQTGFAPRKVDPPEAGRSKRATPCESVVLAGA